LLSPSCFVTSVTIAKQALQPINKALLTISPSLSRRPCCRTRFAAFFPLSRGRKACQTFPQNPGKIPKYLSKIPENLGKYGAQRCFTLKNGAQGLQKNKGRPFFGGHITKTVGKSCTITFWAKIFCTPKNLLAPTAMSSPHFFLRLLQLSNAFYNLHFSSTM